MKNCFLLPMVLSLGAGSLYAGTMGSIEPVSNFGGFYIGLGSGITTVFTKDSFSTARSDGLGGNADTNRYTNTAVLFTGQIGYGAMFNQKTYLGAKASIYYTPLETLDETGFSTAAGNVLIVGNNSFATSLKPIYNIDAVLGYEVTPHFLPFVEAGVSFANAKRNYVFKRTRTNIAAVTNVGYQSSLNLDKYKTGYNVGLGLNYLAASNWVLSTELVYNYLGSKSDSVMVNIPLTTTTETQSRTIRNSDVAMFASISYLMNA
ncbi:outer membrane protein [Legionella tunisiensis]|uniref:outer membrane protein n=1 Tax=Legionella tunisiensis TaxID=1034944 RepID=UPI00030CF792|nr:outer membrane beta-barrel protein [Legionella tunisiensis]